MVGSLARNAPLLLLLAVVFWAGNFLLGRAVRAEVPPVALAFGRWAGASLLLLPFAGRTLWRERHLLRRSLGDVVVLSFLGVATFNTLVYLGLQTTTALNAFLLQALMPVLIVAFGVLAFGERIGGRQGVGLALSLAGAAWVIVEGRPERLLSLALSPGDLLVLTAVLAYAGYSVLLRRRPPMSGLAFVLATFLIGTLMLLPFWAWEAAVRPFEPSAPAFLALLYVMVFPSIVSYLCFNRGVELIGSARAGAFLHLMPALGSLGAVLLLGEAFRSYHALGLAAIALGIALAASGPHVRARRASARAGGGPPRGPDEPGTRDDGAGRG